MQHRLVFLGTPPIAVPTLQALAENPKLRPIAVITEPDKLRGRAQVLTAPAVKVAAEQLGIPVHQPASKPELLTTLRSLIPTLGVVIAYGRILTPDMLAVPTHGFVNLHFSLLPKYRGATPIQAAILAGDELTGVSLMQIDAGLDTGPVIGFVREPIRPVDTAGSLGKRLSELAATLAVTLIPDYLASEALPRPQGDSPTPLAKLLAKDDGQIDWQQPTDTLERFIRAMQPWPGAWTQVDGQRLLIHAAHLTDGHQHLILDRVQLAGKSPVDGLTFERGHQAILTKLIETGRIAPFTRMSS